MNIKFKAVICDLDGLLIDSEFPSLAAWRRAVADFGHDLTESESHKLLGLKPGCIGDLFRKKFDPDLPAEEIIRRRFLYFDQHVKENGMKLKPGAAKMLDWLKRNNIKRAIATSSAKDFGTKNLKSADILKYFDTFVFGNEVKHTKPDPEIFLLAAEKLNVSAAQSVVLEDSENGIRAANAAGMRAILVPDIKLPSQEMIELSHKTFETLEHVLPYLKKTISIN